MTEFNLLSRRNIVISLATFLVFAMGYMAMKTYKNPAKDKPMTYEQEMTKMETQTDSDSLNTIEADLNSTDLDNLDKELNDIELEINAAN